MASAVEVADALSAIPAEDRATWIRCGMAIRAELGPDGFDVWDHWSQSSDTYRTNAARAVWRSFGGSGPVTIRTLFRIARDHGWRPGATHERESPSPAPTRTVNDSSEQDELERARRKRHQAADIWSQALPIRSPAGWPSSPAQEYLVDRGCALPPADGDLRFAPNLRLFGFSGPAMVGRISEIHRPDRGLGLHVTWLERDGERWLRTERRYLGRKGGGVIRLWPDAAVTKGLAIAEGVESALAAGQLFSPIWAVMDAGEMARFPSIPGVEALTIFADADESGTGQAAAAKVAHRWLEAGREARIIQPDVIGLDIADEVAACLR